MATEKIYLKGFRTFPKNEKAPSFVLGTLVITPNEFVAWLKENSQYLTDYNGTKQIKCQILQGDKGVYFTVDTYKKEEVADNKATYSDPKNQIDNSGLPF